MGRKKNPGLRRPNGRLSEAQGARPAHDDLVKNQPHRKPFITLLGDDAAGSWTASFALGRARLIAEAEERVGFKPVRDFLKPGTFDAFRKNGIKPGSLGISERLFFAGMRYAQDVGRERWVRAAPKDKPSAMAFMQARGISLSGREIAATEAQHAIMEYEEASAALIATPCSREVRSVVRTLRQMARDRGASDMINLLRGLGALMNPAASGSIKKSVETLVIDDRDLEEGDLDVARLGLAALADHYYGPERDDYRRINGSVMERPLWLETDFKVIELMYRHYDGTPRKAGEAPKQEPRSASKGSWKNRHSNLR